MIRKVVFSALATSILLTCFSELTQPALAQNAKGIRCKQFDPSMVQSTTVFNTKVYVHTLSAPKSAGVVERCTADIPPFNVCSPSQVSEMGKGRSCQGIWATRMADQGRWLLRARNDDPAGNAVDCSMICH